MKMMVQEMIENKKRMHMTNLTIRPACKIIWTISLVKAVSIETAPGKAVNRKIVFIMVSLKKVKISRNTMPYFYNHRAALARII